MNSRAAAGPLFSRTALYSQIQGKKGTNKRGAGAKKRTLLINLKKIVQKRDEKRRRK